MNPHPRAKCEYCGETKWSVGHRACSRLCAEILGVSAEGLPSGNEKMMGDMRGSRHSAYSGGWMSAGR